MLKSLLFLPIVICYQPSISNELPKAKFSGNPIETGQYPWLVLVTAFYQPSKYSEYYQDPEIEYSDSYNEYKDKDDGSVESNYRQILIMYVIVIVSFTSYVTTCSNLTFPFRIFHPNLTCAQLMIFILKICLLLRV